MQTTRTLLLIALAAAVSACSIEVEAELSLKELFGGKAAGTKALLTSSAGVCTDKESLARTRADVEGIFEDAVYVSCEDDGLSGTVEHRIPVHFDHTDDGKFPADSISFHISGKTVGIHWPRAMDAKVAASEKDERHEVTMMLNLRNDTGKPLQLEFHSVTLRGVEHESVVRELAPNTTLPVVLTPARIDTLRKNGSIPLMTRK